MDIIRLNDLLKSIHCNTMTNWLLRIGDGNNFKESTKYNIWGIRTVCSNGAKKSSTFIENVEEGDRLWFVLNKSRGKILAVATYCSHNIRNSESMTNEELGWVHEGPDWISDIEIHYRDLYNLDHCNLLSEIKGQTSIRKYDKTCPLDLEYEYAYALRNLSVCSEIKRKDEECRKQRRPVAFPRFQDRAINCVIYDYTLGDSSTSQFPASG